jgi:SPFH domain / Band 7 family
VLDDATGKWGLRVNRVEIKAIDPPKTIKDAMEQQMRAERAKRAAILEAEGRRQSQILTAEGDKQAAVLRAEGNRAAQILQAEGQSRAIDQVFQAVHRNDPDPKLLAYQYLQTLPELAKSGNTFWIIPSEVTTALQGVSRAFTEALPKSPATRDTSASDALAAQAADDAEQAAEAAAEAAAAAEPDSIRPITASPGSPETDIDADTRQAQPTDNTHSVPDPRS